MQTWTQIGAQLGISERTVKAHCDALRIRLDVAHPPQIPQALRDRGDLG